MDSGDGRAKQIRPAKTTGGGGFTFEDRVATLALGALLTAHPLLGAEHGPIISIVWQARALGWHLDDLLIELDGPEHARCAASIKSFDMLAGGRAHAEFVAAAWRSLLGDGQFDSQRDLLGMFSGAPESAATWRDLHVLVTNAQVADPEDLAVAIDTQAHGVTRRVLYASFSCPPELADRLPVSTGAAPALLLSRLVALPYDFERPPSESHTQSLRLAEQALIPQQASQATDLHNALLELASQARPAMGRADWPSLQLRLGKRFAFALRPDIRADATLLADSAAARTSHLPDRLGGRLKLGRDDSIGRLADAVTDEMLVALVGPSGCGKSVLARDWLSAQPCGIWLDAEQLERGLDGLRQQMGTARRLDRLLALMPHATAMVVDGLDRCFAAAAFGAVADIVAAMSACDDLRLVVPVQSAEWPRVARELRAAAGATGFTLVEAAELSDADLAEAYDAFPSLRSFAMRNRLSDVLRRPKVLDLLAAALTEGTSTDLLEGDLDESRFALWFWQHLAEGNGPQRLARGVGLQRLADAQARELRSATPQDQLDEPLLAHADELIRDGLLDQTSGQIRFAHDIYGDWTRFAALTAHADELATWLSERLDSPLWHRAVRLRAVALLAADPSGDAWEAERAMLHAAGVTAARSLYLEAALFAPRPYRTLAALWPRLTADGAGLLIPLLESFLFIATFPDPRVIEAMADQHADLELHVASSRRLPNPALWIGPLTLFAEHGEQLAELALPQLAQLTTTWLTGTPPGMPLRTEAADLALTLGRRVFERQTHGAHLDRELADACWRSVLAAGAERPTAVKRFVLAAFEDKPPAPAPADPGGFDEANRELRRHILAGPQFDLPEGVMGSAAEDELRTTILGSNALTGLIGTEPQAAHDLLLAAALTRETPDSIDDDLINGRGHQGIFAAYDWHAAWPERGPMRAFFALAPDIAMTALLAMIARATSRPDPDRLDGTPIELHANLDGTTHRWAGTVDQLLWHRGAQHTSVTLASALMAAEAWLYELEDTDPGRLDEIAGRLLHEDASLVSIGLLTTLTCRFPRLLAGPLRVLAGMPDLMILDAQSKHLPAIGFGSQLFVGEPAAVRQRLAQWDGLPHRGVSLRELAVRLMLFDDQMRPFMAERLADLEARVAGGEDHLADLALELDPAHWEPYTDADGNTGFKPVIPEHRDQELQQQRQELAIGQFWMLFPHQCRTLIDSDESPTDEDLQAFWDHAQQGLDTQPPELALHTPDDARRHTEAGIAAALVLRGPPWLARRPDIGRWCRTALLAPLAGWQDPGVIDRSSGVGAWEWPGFCADAVPVLWAQAPDDVDVRRAIASLACGPDYETVNRLFASVAARRQQLGDHARRLQTFSIQRADALNLLAARRHQSQPWDFERHQHAHRDIGPPPEFIASTIADFVAGRTPTQPPDAWGADAVAPSPEQEAERSLPADSPRLDMHYLQAAWAWLPALRQAATEAERQEWLGFWRQMRNISVANMRAESKGRRGLPGEWERWLLGRLAEVTLDMRDDEDPNAIWQSFLEAGLEAENWIDDLFQGLFQATLAGAASTAVFAARWQQLLGFGEDQGLWSGRPSLRLTQAVAGIDDVTRYAWGAEHESLLAAIRQPWSAWVIRWLPDEWFAERFAIFLRVVAVPTWLLNDSMGWLQANIGAYTGRRGQSAIAALDELMEHVWRRDPDLLTGPGEAARSGRMILDQLAAAGSALARQIQDALRGR